MEGHIVFANMPRSYLTKRRKFPLCKTPTITHSIIKTSTRRHVVNLNSVTETQCSVATPLTQGHIRSHLKDRDGSCERRILITAQHIELHISILAPSLNRFLTGEIQTLNVPLIASILRSQYTPVTFQKGCFAFLYPSIPLQKVVFRVQQTRTFSRRFRSKT